MNGVQNEKNNRIFAHQFVLLDTRGKLWIMFLHSDL